MKLSSLILGITGTLFAASLSGCIIVEDPGPEDAGSLSVDVTIDSRNDTFVCDAFAVDQIRIALIDEAGFPTEQEIDCDAFGLTFDGVPAGFYDVQVTLLDHGSPVSAIMGGSDIVVVEDMDTQVSVDIPASSIF